MINIVAEEVVTTLPMPPAAYGLIAVGALVSLLLVTVAFRHVSRRH